MHREKYGTSGPQFVDSEFYDVSGTWPESLPSSLRPGAGPLPARELRVCGVRRRVHGSPRVAGCWSGLSRLLDKSEAPGHGRCAPSDERSDASG